MVVNNISNKNQDDNPDSNLQHELIVSGLLSLDGGLASVEIRRGMTILTTEGDVAGTVAGVINNREPQQVKYILLTRPSQQVEYRLVPVGLIQQVSKGQVVLDILTILVNNLPQWRN